MRVDVFGLYYKFDLSCPTWILTKYVDSLYFILNCVTSCADNALSDTSSNFNHKYTFVNMPKRELETSRFNHTRMSLTKGIFGSMKSVHYFSDDILHYLRCMYAYMKPFKVLPKERNTMSTSP